MPVIPFSPPPVSGIPERCKSLPRQVGTGYPVPASAFEDREAFLQASALGQTPFDPVGMDHFGDTTAWEESRCGVCSEALEATCQVVLWESPKSKPWLYPSEPPMHEECTEYSLQVCPVLKGKVTEAETGTIYKTYFVATLATSALEAGTSHRVPRSGLRDIRKFQGGKLRALIDQAKDPWTEVKLVRRNATTCPVNHGRTL